MRKKARRSTPARVGVGPCEVGPPRAEPSGEEREHDAADHRADDRRDPRERGRTGPREDRGHGQGARDPEGHDAERGTYVLQDSRDRRRDDDREREADEQRDLVVLAERGDRELLERLRHDVDDEGADREDRAAVARDEQREELGRREERPGAHDPRECGPPPHPLRARRGRHAAASASTSAGRDSQGWFVTGGGADWGRAVPLARRGRRRRPSSGHSTRPAPARIGGWTRSSPTRPGTPGSACCPAGASARSSASPTRTSWCSGPAASAARSCRRWSPRAWAGSPSSTTTGWRRPTCIARRCTRRPTSAGPRSTRQRMPRPPSPPRRPSSPCRVASTRPTPTSSSPTPTS